MLILFHFATYAIVKMLCYIVIKKLISDKLDNINNSLININDNLVKINHKQIELNSNLIQFLKNNFYDLKTYLDKKFDDISSSIKTAQTEIISEIGISAGILGDAILGVIPAINSNLFLQLSWQTGEQRTAEFSSFKMSINSSIKNLQHSINKSINDFENNIKIFLKDNLKKYIIEGLNDWVKKNKKILYEELVEQICCNIVGESYIKYDGVIYAYFNFQI